MALSHYPEWAKQADEATARRARENRPWKRRYCEYPECVCDIFMCEHYYKSGPEDCIGRVFNNVGY